MPAKLLLYLAAGRLQALVVRRDHFLWDAGFSADSSGVEKFSDYLASRRPAPTYLLLDVADEAFQTETIPPLSGTERRGVIERKLSQTFRNAHYVGSTSQGREATGRRDERLLMSSLTNADLLTPWLDVLSARQVPLIGIGSMALWSEALARRLNLQAPHLLLVTLQSSNVFRQSYLCEGGLRFSRLATISDGQTARTVAQEADRMRQYLNMQRLMTGEEVLRVVVLAPRALFAQLEEECRETSDLNFTFLAPDRSADDGLALETLLALSRPKHFRNYYAQRQELRPYRARQSGRALYAISAALLCTSLGFSARNVMLAAQDTQHAEHAESVAAGHQREYDQATMSAFATELPVGRIYSIGQIYTAISSYPKSPAPAWTQLSSALEQVPGIQLDKLSWIATHDPAIDPTGDSKSEPVLLPVARQARPASGSAHYEILVLEAHVAPSVADRQIGRASIDRLRTLLSEAGFQIIPTQLSDSDARGSLQGTLGEDQATQRVVLRLIKAGRQ